MSTTMNALNSASIIQAEFVRLITASNTYYFCNASSAITVDGMTFTNLGSLMTISQIQRDIKATSADMSIQLTGVDGSNVGIILSSDIKGSNIDIWRGFLDSNNQIITSPSQQFFKRYTGIVSSVSISEDFNAQLRTRVATCGLSCASFRTILENRVQGVKTVPKAWNFFYPGDTSMDRVPVIASTFFDFGKPPTTGGQAQAPGGTLIDNGYIPDWTPITNPDR